MKATHPITESDLNAYVDGEFAPDRRDEIEVYLVTEPLHAARVETWRRQNEIIRAAFAKVAAEPLPTSHLNALHPPSPTRAEAFPQRKPPPCSAEEREIDNKSRQTSRLQNSRMAGIAAAAFAAGALVTMVAAQWTGTVTDLFSQTSSARPSPRAATSSLDPGQATASRAIEAYHTYALDVVRPVEVNASKEAFLASWLSRRVGLTIDIPDLSSEGLALLGGRLTPGEWGPAAFLLYETSGGDRTGLFISRVATHNSQPLSSVEEHSARAVYWIDGGAIDVLAGSMSFDKLTRIARFLAGKNRSNSP